MRHLAQGFLDYPANGLTTEEEHLRGIYDASLILLYRLLFILYAEARELLPLRENTDYRESYSLYALKHDVERNLENNRTLSPTRASLWPRLADLFSTIAEGDASLGVPIFDGGLFDPEKHPFLEQNAVGDRHLQQAVDMLARVGGQFVDYRDLSERHLGTIYEGLLEYHLEASAPERDWTVDLLNDKGERHATGSYYTPDFVVKYIVERTVGPTLREVVASARTDEERIQNVLELNVLDPAMGSGHFLIETTEFIARFLVELGVSETDDGSDSEAELAYWKRRVVQSCVYGVDANPLAVELAKLSLWLSTVAKDRPLSFLDHHLRSGNSLVGARIQALAPAPKRKRKTVRDDAQLSMLSDDAFRQSMSNAVGSMWLIEESPSDSVEEVREQERLYANLRESLTRRYARLADLATATRFGVEVDARLWDALADYATKTNVAALPQFEGWLQQAESVAAERRFFHWELEFPEVFFDRQGNPRRENGAASAGFDAVVGNPPYVRQEAVGAYKPYFAADYPETYHGVADLYVYFYQLGLRHLRPGGRMGYIVTNKWLRAGYGEPLRTYFAERGALEEIIDFGHAPIFPDADVFPCIVVLRKPEREDTGDESVRVVSFPREALGKVGIPQYAAEHGHSVPRRRFGKSAWSLESSAVDDLMEKIRTRGVPLAEFTSAKPLAGVKTGLNEAFLISTQTKEQLTQQHPALIDHIKPYLRGRDIKRWSPSWEGLWIILLRSSNDFSWPWASHEPEQAEKTFRTTFPALYDHMESRKDRLKARSDQGKFWWELRSCAYYNAFDRANIFYQDLAFHSRFGIGSPGTVAEMTCFILPTSDKWLLSVLNSPLLWSYMWRNVIHGKDEVLRLKNVYTEKLPIAPPTDEARLEAEGAVERLISLAAASQEARREMLDWLRVEFGVEKPGQKLHDFAALDADTFVDEVRKRRPKGAGRLTPGALRDLRSGYGETANPVREARDEAAGLERRLSDLVNEAYGLTPEEVDLLWNTAPPRMPRF